MYSKELEELIDSVVADGVITEQERVVLHKRTLLCGEDPNEVIVVVEGRIAKMKNSTKPTDGKHGSIVRCPSCGSVVEYGKVKCPECGYEFKDVEAVSSVQEITRLLEKAMKEKESFWNSKKEENVKSIIKNFPIPNSKEDLLEFMSLCLTHINDEHDYYSETWSEKAKQVRAKIEIMLKDDPDAKVLLEHIDVENDKRKRRKVFTAICIVAFFLLLIGGLTTLFIFGETSDDKKLNISQEINLYADSLNTCVKNIPTPTADNYQDCMRAFMNVTWDKSFANPFDSKSEYDFEVGNYEQVEKLILDSKREFFNKKQAYACLLRASMRQAGVTDKDIPTEILDAENFWTIKDETPAIENEETDETKETETDNIEPDMVEPDMVETEK